MESGFISLLPPLLAIVLAIATRHVYFSLLGGIWLGCTLLAGGNPLVGISETIESVITVLTDPGDARIVIFTLLIGALIATMEGSSGVKGFVSWVESRRWVTNAKTSQWLAWGIGVVVFVESNITLLVAGAVSRPLFDRFRVSREKLAYIIDSTSAPICILIPLNAWGAFNLGLLNNIGDTTPLATFVAAIPYNFYAIAAIVLVPLLIVSGVEIGPMKKAQQRTREGKLLWPNAVPMIDPNILSGADEGPRPLARNMLAPMLAMILMMPVGLYITGDGNLMAGSGSVSLIWATLLGLAVAWVLLFWQRAMSMRELSRLFSRGASGLMPVALILLLALALGNLTERLGTGAYVASAVGEWLPPVLLLPTVFLVAAVTAFSIGSSWGTFAIMVPIAVPTGLALGLPVAPFFAAVLSGGIFGDHASPISDTTVVASLASATDHIDHVRTQLPYALIAAAISLLGFFIVGLFL